MKNFILFYLLMSFNGGVFAGSENISVYAYSLMQCLDINGYKDEKDYSYNRFSFVKNDQLGFEQLHNLNNFINKNTENFKYDNFYVKNDKKSLKANKVFYQCYDCYQSNELKKYIEFELKNN